MFGDESARDAHDGAGLAGEQFVADLDQSDAGIGLLDDREGGLAHGRAFDRVGQHRLLRGVDAHGHDLDVVATGLDHFPQPVLQRRVGHRAGRLRGKAGGLARGCTITLEGLRGRDARGKMRGEPRHGHEHVLAAGRRRHHFHVDAARPRDTQRRDARDVDVERAGGQRLDGMRARLEGRQGQIETGLPGPSFMVDHEDRRRADHRDIADTNGDPRALRYRRGGQQRHAARQEGATLKRRQGHENSLQTGTRLRAARLR